MCVVIQSPSYSSSNSLLSTQLPVPLSTGSAQEYTAIVPDTGGNRTISSTWCTCEYRPLTTSGIPDSTPKMLQRCGRCSRDVTVSSEHDVTSRCASENGHNGTTVSHGDDETDPRFSEFHETRTNDLSPSQFDDVVVESIRGTAMCEKAEITATIEHRCYYREDSDIDRSGQCWLKPLHLLFSGILMTFGGLV